MAKSKDMREENNSEYRRQNIIAEICKQIEPYLPVRSREELLKKMDSVTVGSQKIPLKFLAPHISEDIFPIKSMEDVSNQVSEGVQRALSLGRSAKHRSQSIKFTQALSDLSEMNSKAQLRKPAMFSVYYPDSDA